MTRPLTLREQGLVDLLAVAMAEAYCYAYPLGAVAAGPMLARLLPRFRRRLLNRLRRKRP